MLVKSHQYRRTLLWENAQDQFRGTEMRINESRFELMDIYNRKMLADRAKLALMRVKRVNAVLPKEKVVFTRLSVFLQAASDGDKAISNSQMGASSDQSLQALRQTLIALRGIFQETDSFRHRLNELVSTTDMLSEGKIPSAEALQNLLEFLERYSAIQSESIRDPQALGPGEAVIWPLVRHKQSFSTP